MKVNFYMKSGNKISVTGIKDLDFKYKGNEITSISVVFRRFRTGKSKIIVASLNLSQIEAITSESLFGF